MSQTDPSDVTATLLAHRDAFKGFLNSRIGSEADAEDLLQSGLVKALERAGEIKEHEKIVPWFYQVLRNAMWIMCAAAAPPADATKRGRSTS